MVENLANGVGERELTTEELLAGRAANRKAVAGALEATGAGVGMSLAVKGARLDGELVGLRVEEGSIVALGPGVGSQAGR